MVLGHNVKCRYGHRAFFCSPPAEQRRRPWVNDKATLDKYVVFAGQELQLSPHFFVAICFTTK